MVDVVERLIKHKVLALTGSEDIEFSTNVHIEGNLTVSGTGAGTAYYAGEGLDLTAGSVFSGEYATTGNRGISYYNSNDFNITSGYVSLKNKTTYWSAPGVAFQPEHEATNYLKSQYGQMKTQDPDEDYFVQVNIPNGAVITSVIVYGTDSSSTWRLRRHTLNAATYSNVMDSTFNTAVNGTHTVNNNSYGYFIWIKMTVDNSDVWGAKITYTTDYD